MTIHDRLQDGARSLRRDVERGTDTGAALERVTAADSGGRAGRVGRAGRAGRVGGVGTARRWLPAVAAVVLLAGGVGAFTLGAGDDGDGEEVSTEIDPTPDPDGESATALQLLAPDDGRESIQLPVILDVATDLVDGQAVHVEASGFEPGEGVGVVQCVDEAGPPARLGIDACLIAPFVSLTADDDGRVAGTYEVHRYLTVPVAGTVDCAAVAERCLIGVGALANYDRSGGARLTFAGGDADGGGGPAVPTIDVAAVAGLADGQVVAVSGQGFDPDAAVDLQVCSTSPAVCTYTRTLPVDGDGGFAGEVRLWRFLPGPDTGTYVDCTVSACALRLIAPLAPTPVPLAFAGTEPAPEAPVLVVQPNEDLGPGDFVRVTADGLPPGSGFLSLCTREPAEQASPAPGVGSRPFEQCTSVGAGEGSDGGEVMVADDGTLEATIRLGRFDPVVLCSDCDPVTPDESWDYILQFASMGSEILVPEQAARSFPPAPVVLDFEP